jgi:hypothetical protein
MSSSRLLECVRFARAARTRNASLSPYRADDDDTKIAANLVAPSQKPRGVDVR